MAVNLSSGAISKIVTGKCTENDLYKPVLQVIHIDGLVTRSKEGKQLYQVWLSDGSFFKTGYIPYDIFISNKLQKGSIFQLLKFQLATLFNSKGEIISKSGIRVCDLNLCHTTCDIIGDPKLLPDNETPLVERSTPTISDEDHANSHHVEVDAGFKQLDTKEDDEIGACFEKMEKLGWGEGPMYDTVVLLFGESSDYRKIWLHLKPNSCVNWVKNAGSKYGLLG